MVDFELSPTLAATRQQTHMLAEHAMRPIGRHYDENEHEKPWDFINTAWQIAKSSGIVAGRDQKEKREKASKAEPDERGLRIVIAVEELSWGDAGLYLCIPGPGLGGAAVMSVGTPEQKQRFLSRFKGDKPVWSAMAITEAEAGSDSAAIQTTAVRDGDHWVLNGTKIFCTSGLMAGDPANSNGFIVVWATVDRSAGRAGIKSFIVDAGTPGMTVAKVEDKLGIRASDTATLIFEDCRIPLDNILGSPEVPKTNEGFKGVMATFDATRPIVAASAIGVGRAALDFVREEMKKQGVEVRYGVAPHKLTAVERDFMDMEAQLQAARLLTWRAAWMMDRGERNALEASMAKAKAGQVVTQVTQKAVELLGPLGYSRKLLLEKWMRDAKINDIFEGTQQINMLIIARRILGYTSKDLS